MGHESGPISFSKVLISGAGFLADAYDLFVINVVVDIMSDAGYKQPLTTELKSIVKTTALIGAMVGQLFFGSVADLIGRRKVFIMTCSLVIIGALLSATVQDSSGSFGIYSQLALWRFFLGVGVGGEYPLSAAITSESSAKADQTKNLAMVFSMQGFGTVLCSLVLVIVSNALGTDYDTMWRIAIGFGGFPMVCAFYFRWKMHETSWAEEAEILQITTGRKSENPSMSSRTSKQLKMEGIYHADESNSQEVKNQLVTSQIAVKDDSSVSHSEGTLVPQSTYEYLVINANYAVNIVSKNKWKLIGTAGAWLILDIVFYANSLFGGQVTKAMGFGGSPVQESLSNLILTSIGLPGYLCTILFVDQIGLRRLQLYGFNAVCFFFLLLAVLQPYLIEVPALYIIIYGLTFFFQNFGANVTTYIIPSLLYDTSNRATCHGISAAAGKLGAIIGSETFVFLQYSFCANDKCTDDSPKSDVNSGLQITFFVCGTLAFIGSLWTYFFVIVKDSDVLDPKSNSLNGDVKDKNSIHNSLMKSMRAEETKGGEMNTR